MVTVLMDWDHNFVEIVKDIAPLDVIIFLQNFLSRMFIHALIAEFSPILLISVQKVQEIGVEEKGSRDRFVPSPAGGNPGAEQLRVAGDDFVVDPPAWIEEGIHPKPRNAFGRKKLFLGVCLPLSLSLQELCYLSLGESSQSGGLD